MDLKKIEELIKTSKQLKSLLPGVRKNYFGSLLHEDGFNLKRTKQSMNISNLCYFSYTVDLTGDTYSDISEIDKEIMKEYFLKYLNAKKNEIIEGMAQMMIDDVKKEKDVALEDLEKRKQELMELLGE